MSRKHAAVMLDALGRRGNEPVDWKGMSGRQREAAKELMVLTHVAEGAVPRRQEVRVPPPNR